MGLTTPTYEVDYNDERFQQNAAQEQAELSQSNNMYNSMIEQSDSFYQAQSDAIEQWGQQQQQIQQANTDFTIEQIEQQKEQAEKEYKKEQAGAYVDLQKQSNKYGANAEQMAASGLTNTGFSESSQVSMYNTYQNRVAVAKESFGQATLEYNNAIKEARLANDSAQAEIAFNTYLQKTQLALEGFQYKNGLLESQFAQQQAIVDRYYNRYQDILAQINQENALAEESRQFTETMNYQQEQDRIAYDQWLKEYNLSQAQLEEEKRQYDASLAEEQRQFDLANAAKNSTNVALLETGSSGGSNSSLNSGSNNSTLNSGSSASLKNMAGGVKYTAPMSSNTKATTSTVATCGNSKSTTSKSDYYFKNGYQPQYVNDKKLGKTGYDVGYVLGNKLASYGVKSDQNVWRTSDGKAWVWIDSEKEYIDVTKELTNKVGKSSVLSNLVNLLK